MAKVKGSIEPLTFNYLLVLAMAKGPSMHAFASPSVLCRYLDFALPLTLVASACASLAGT